ncbi:bifunctional tRNA pseudouridine(32) synthase/23S rRNA pseudouridine(746) synthase RluA [Neptunicella marina]|uniref:Dual-specificity RNA pseudouridine synthase RluA n=1 Tax=Neptunicella marina TaxID=2125989 RepID=A0A8J6LYP9_9ALTE|nr:bifunctional tRNA pseudouridine(32) synthase/23S rRNA pseudouridine(746) synthase RluA [Neptunicella marina]MBC3766254.1 bifunctional tRNA pseudouridine(32) synthase/23S rRNA pseudouridine(746) synthase RluA [Neptunicella marina]
MTLLHYQPPLYPYLNILYRDDDFIVLNKPSGLLSVPGKATEHKDSLQLRVQRVFPTATIVHRLDMATSGVMVMALNKAAHRHISLQFEKRLTKKRYFARVFGKVADSEGLVDLPLICDWPNRPKQMVDFERGKPAQTNWKRVQQFDGYAVMELTPITGRSHQLRVHMLSLGHPILGDRLYAHEQAKSMAPRLQLHAQLLTFTHPTNNTQLSFEAPCEFLA